MLEPRSGSDSYFDFDRHHYDVAIDDTGSFVAKAYDDHESTKTDVETMIRQIADCVWKMQIASKPCPNSPKLVNFVCNLLLYVEENPELDAFVQRVTDLIPLVHRATGDDAIIKKLAELSLHPGKTTSFTPSEFPKDLTNKVCDYLCLKEIAKFIRGSVKNASDIRDAYIAQLENNDRVVSEILDKAGGSITELPDTFQEIIRAVAPTIYSLRLPETSLNIENVDELVEAFTNLTSLDISISNIDDKSFKALVKLAGLKKLNLNTCFNLTPKGLKHLRALKNLRELDLSSVEIHDATLSIIATHLKKLTKLTLYEAAKLTHEGFEHLAKCEMLDELSVGKCPINKDSLLLLTSLTNLRKLNLSECRSISPEGFECLLLFPKLEEIDLRDTHINDEGVQHLALMKQLRKVNFGDNKDITPKALEDLRKKLPHLEIVS